MITYFVILMMWISCTQRQRVRAPSWELIMIDYLISYKEKNVLLITLFKAPAYTRILIGGRPYSGLIAWKVHPVHCAGGGGDLGKWQPSGVIWWMMGLLRARWNVAPFWTIYSRFRFILSSLYFVRLMTYLTSRLINVEHEKCNDELNERNALTMF